jgi:succinate dehydrogenase / fumarate reductase cytochrome b subunit
MLLLYRKIFHSSVGRKFVVACTGSFLILFIFFHMLGNFLIFFGPDALNAYAATLQGLGRLLWMIRLFFLIMLIMHISLSIQLQMENLRARPAGYIKRDFVRATLASRTMPLTGFTIFAFLIYHLLHYTMGVAHPEYYGFVDHQGRHDVYRMVVLSFSEPGIVIAYLISVSLLSFHLSHALGSMFQTLGFVCHGIDLFLLNFSNYFAILILIGFGSVPLAIALKIVE